jgi:streptogramin lyase
VVALFLLGLRLCGFFVFSGSLFGLFVVLLFGSLVSAFSGRFALLVSRSVASTTAGVVTHYRDPRLGGLVHITTGPDGALWFTDGSSIGRMTTAGAFSFYAVARGAPQMITAGPDGALWFTNSTGTAGGWIGRISTAGVITRYDDPSIIRPGGITTGPDGALWFANSASFSFPGSIGRITTAGVVTNYSAGCKRTNVEACSGTSGPGAITAGPDGALWFRQISTVSSPSGGSPRPGSSPASPIPVF